MKTGNRLILLLSIQMGCMSFGADKAVAQDVTTSTNVFVPEGLSISVDGSISNTGSVFNNGSITLALDLKNTTSTGFILNNGSITLSGDWLNSSLYQGLGTILLVGSDQEIRNNSQSMNALSIDGGGTKTVTGILTIDRLLTFTEGIVKVSDEDTLKILYTGAIEGGSSLSYVDGALIMDGIGRKFFPVGVGNGKYHPVELHDVTGFQPGIEIEVHETLPDIQLSVPSTPINEIYWTRKVVRGRYDGSAITVQYNVREGIEPDHLVMLEGDSLEDEFTTRETTLEQLNGLDKIESWNTTSGNIIALAELAGEPPREYYFSTTLSPNAANPDNRSIRIFGDHVTARNFRFQVFNRWGQVVFESTSAANMSSQGWDGKRNGNILASGVYPYSLTYVDTTGKVVKRTGFVTIIQ